MIYLVSLSPSLQSPLESLPIATETRETTYATEQNTDTYLRESETASHHVGCRGH